MAKRPLAVTIIGGLEFLLGVIAPLAVAFVYVSGNNGGDMFVIAGGIITGVISIIIGYGMLSGWTIMWWLGVIFNIISIIGGILTFPVGILNVVISAVILYYLFRPGVKKFFDA